MVKEHHIRSIGGLLKKIKKVTNELKQLAEQIVERKNQIQSLLRTHLANHGISEARRSKIDFAVAGFALLSIAIIVSGAVVFSLYAAGIIAITLSAALGAAMILGVLKSLNQAIIDSLNAVLNKLKSLHKDQPALPKFNEQKIAQACQKADELLKKGLVSSDELVDCLNDLNDKKKKCKKILSKLDDLYKKLKEADENEANIVQESAPANIIKDTCVRAGYAVAGFFKNNVGNNKATSVFSDANKSEVADESPSLAG